MDDLGGHIGIATVTERDTLHIPNAVVSLTRIKKGSKLYFFTEEESSKLSGTQMEQFSGFFVVGVLKQSGGKKN